MLVLFYVLRSEVEKMVVRAGEVQRSPTFYSTTTFITPLVLVSIFPQCEFPRRHMKKKNMF